MQGDEETEAALRSQARQVFLDVVADDQTAYGAYVMLSVIDRDSVEEGIAWARQAVAVNPDSIMVRGLVSLLFDLGTAAAIAEAVEFAENAYINAQPSPEKWRAATYAAGTHDAASLHFPGTVAPVAADEFRSRARQDSDWDTAVRTLDDPADNAADVQDALQTLCRLAGVLGAEPCLQGIEATARAALNAPDRADAQILADAAAIAMMAAPRGSRVVVPGRQMPMLMAWLDRFSSSQLDSVAVLDVIATVSLDPERRRETRREIVLRNPNDGRSRFDLGKIYYDQRRWADAVVELELAMELSPPEDRLLIGSYHRQAVYEAGNTDQ